jgi:hypothetical protein
MEKHESSVDPHPPSIVIIMFPPTTTLRKTLNDTGIVLYYCPTMTLHMGWGLICRTADTPLWPMHDYSSTSEERNLIVQYGISLIVAAFTNHKYYYHSRGQISTPKTLEEGS